jgi:hypothetical protein
MERSAFEDAPAFAEEVSIAVQLVVRRESAVRDRRDARLHRGQKRGGS